MQCSIIVNEVSTYISDMPSLVIILVSLTVIAFIIKFCLVLGDAWYEIVS